MGVDVTALVLLEMFPSYKSVSDKCAPFLSSLRTEQKEKKKKVKSFCISKNTEVRKLWLV